MPKVIRGASYMPEVECSYTELWEARSTWGRALSENEPKAKFEFSACPASSLNEVEPMANIEFSEAVSCSVIRGGTDFGPHVGIFINRELKHSHKVTCVDDFRKSSGS